MKKETLIKHIKKVKPDWEVGRNCKKNCSQCDGFKKAIKKVIELIEKEYATPVKRS